MSREWEDEHGKFQHRISGIEQEKAEMDKDYTQKTALLRTELQNYERNLQERIARIEEERQVQLQMVEDRIAQVQKEKTRQDELYQIQLEKLEQDKLYQERMNRLKDDTRNIDKVHAENQELLRRQRDTLEASFHENDDRNRIPTLKRLKEIEDEYEVADKHLDVRGWIVLGNKGESIGKINELIVDTEAMKVRYLDVDTSLTKESGDRHVLIPIGVATIDQKDDKVIIPNLDRSMVMKCPSYSGETVTRDYEHTLLTILSPDYNVGSGSSENFYNQQSFDDTKFYGERKKRKAKIFNR
jgi:sporulation protein YlmC with PRC-barrel domain